MDPRTVGNNIARMLSATGGWIHLVTFQGVVREGRLSGWACKMIKLNGADIQIPVSIELNGDPFDVVLLSNIQSMDVTNKP